MPSRPAFAIGAVLIAAGIAAPAASAGTTSAGPAVLHDVQASTADVPLINDDTPSYPIKADRPQPDTETEPSVAVNPADPNNVVAVFQEDRVDNGGDADNGYTTTFDGGKTWIHGYLPGNTRDTGGTFDRASDAVVAFGADPTNPGHYDVYVSTLVFDDGSGADGDTSQSGMSINISKDGGKTWSNAIVLEQDGLEGLNDKNWIAVDNGTGVGHHTGRIYIVWDRIAPLVYSYCDPDVAAPGASGPGCDKLANWSSSPNNNGAFYSYDPMPGIGSIPLIEPDGSLGIVFQGDFGGTPAIHSPPTDQPDMSVGGSQLMFAEAKGAGAVPFPLPLTFTQAAVGIASNQGNAVAQQRAGTLPAAAVDPVTGQIYVAWEDGRNRTDGLNDLVFSTSTDGITWSPVKRVNTDPEGSGIDHWNAMIDVARDGSVHIGYRTRVEKPTMSDNIDTYYQESTDHGATWSAPLKVNAIETDVRYAAFSRGGAFLGDYNQVATASNGVTYLAHNEAHPAYDGEPCNCSFTTGNGHQHQDTWVAAIGAAPGPSLPEVPWAPALLAAGIMVIGFSLRRPGKVTA